MMGLMFWLPGIPGHSADDYDLFHFYWSYFNILITLQFGIFLRCQWWLKTKFMLTFDFHLRCLEFIKPHYSYAWTGRGVSLPNFISEGLNHYQVLFIHNNSKCLIKYNPILSTQIFWMTLIYLLSILNCSAMDGLVGCVYSKLQMAWT